MPLPWPDPYVSSVYAMVGTGPDNVFAAVSLRPIGFVAHWDGARWGNVRSLADYCDALLGGRSPREFEERLEPEAKARETLVMALRRTDGVEPARFREETGFELEALCGGTLERLAGLGLILRTDESVRLSEKGLFVSDAVFAELV